MPTGARLEAGQLQAEPVAKECSLRGGMAKRWPILARRVDLSHGERYTSTDWLTNFLSIPRSHVLERIVGRPKLLKKERKKRNNRREGGRTARVPSPIELSPPVSAR